MTSKSCPQILLVTENNGEAEMIGDVEPFERFPARKLSPVDQLFGTVQTPRVPEDLVVSGLRHVDGVEVPIAMVRRASL